MPLLFRFHKGGLDESMKTVVEIDSLKSLREKIEEIWTMDGFNIEVKPYVFDKRVNWDTHLVLICNAEQKISYAVGYLNRLPEWI